MVNAGGPRGRAGLAALAGVLTALAFPNASLVPLLAVCLVPLLLALEGLPARRAASVASVYGFVFWIVTVPWVAFTVHRFGEVAWPVAALALVCVAVLMIPPFALFGAVVGAIRPDRPALRMIVFPAAWVVQEAFRTDWYFWGGFPWSLLAYPLARVPPLMQSAALGGAWFTSALVVAVNGALLEARYARGRRRLAWGGGAVAAVALAWLLGDVAMQRVDTPAATETRLRVAVIQPNVAQEVRWTAESREEIWASLVAQTRDVVAKERPRLVLWPESAVPYAWSYSPKLRAELPALCRELDVAILLSTVWSDQPESDDAPYYNAALLVTKDGPVLPAYFKQHLVAFGEYVPAAKVLRMIKPISRAVPGGFTPGQTARLIPFDGTRLGGAVCYEVVYPSVARDEARAGADVLFTLTNDAWYGSMGAREQHWQAASFRAVETRLPLVRAAITGISGLVDPEGRVRARLGPDEKGSFVVEVPARRTRGKPLAVSLAGPFALVCAAGCAALILRAWRGRRSAARVNPA